MPTLFVYLPCYNEAGNLRRLTEEWLAEAEALASTTRWSSTSLG